MARNTASDAYDVQFNALGECDQLLPPRGSHISRSPSIEECDAKDLLDLGQPSSNGRSVDREHPGRRGESSTLADCPYDPKVVPVTKAAVDALSHVLSKEMR